MSVNESLGIGLVGAGAMGRAYCECLKRYVTDAHLVAVTGGRRAEALAADYHVPADPDLAALLRRADIGAVIIATPEMLHREQTLQAAGAGRHVLVEKPMAPDVASCDVMIAACARAGVQLMVVKHWRFRGVHTRALQLLRGGTLGRIEKIENHTLVALTSSLATIAQKPFYADPAGGGLLMGWAVHNLDWVRCVAGSEPAEVRAVASTAAPDELAWGRLDADISFVDGTVAAVSVAIDLKDPPGPDHVFRTTIATAKEKLDLDGYGALAVDRGDGPQRIWTQPVFDPRNATDPRRLKAYAAMVQGFVGAVRTNTTPPVTGHDGRMAVALFLAAMESAARGRAVRLIG